jgi:hypothetical protein
MWTDRYDLLQYVYPIYVVQDRVILEKENLFHAQDPYCNY